MSEPEVDLQIVPRACRVDPDCFLVLAPTAPSAEHGRPQPFTVAVDCSFRGVVQLGKEPVLPVQASAHRWGRVCICAHVRALPISSRAPEPGPCKFVQCSAADAKTPNNSQRWPGWWCISEAMGVDACTWTVPQIVATAM